MMEIGQILFGRSMHRFEVDRCLQDDYYENIGDKLEDRFQEFENDTFRIFPYYWGDCTCGYEKLELDWDKNNSHAGDCVRSRGDYTKKCTCDYDSRWLEFIKANNHEETCPVIQPNFWYKPTNYCINWYKYPLRGATQNQELTNSQIVEIFYLCGKSMNNSNQIK